MNEEKVISQLKEIYSRMNNLSQEQGNSIVNKKINSHDLAMHGTNAFVFLLACLTGKKLLPGNEREKLGIPTVNGEANHSINIEKSNYHEEWQNFISAAPLNKMRMSSNDDYCYNEVLGYSNRACEEFKCNYNKLETKWLKTLKNKNLDILFNDIDKTSLSDLYETLSNIPVIIIGYGSRHNIDYRCPLYDYKYEQVDIISVVIPNDEDIQQDVKKILIDMTEAYKMMPISRNGLETFFNKKQDDYCEKTIYIGIDCNAKFGKYLIKDIPQDDELIVKFAESYGYSVKDLFEKHGNTKLIDLIRGNARIPYKIEMPYTSEAFVNYFKDKLPYEFYHSDKKNICTKTFTYKDNYGSHEYTKEVKIEYSIPYEEMQDLHIQNLQENNTELLAVNSGELGSTEYLPEGDELQGLGYLEDIYYDAEQSLA